MDEEEIIKSLRKEGFKGLFVHTDSPGAFYPEHTHSTETCHFVLEGEMTVYINENTETYSGGQRFDVPAGETHSARAGSEGCRYIIGEK